MPKLSIIFKFRDEILLTKPSEASPFFNVSDRYYDEALKWYFRIWGIAGHGLESIENKIQIGNGYYFRNKTLIHDGVEFDRIVPKIKNQLHDLFDVLETIDAEKRYLFDRNPIESFNKFETRINHNQEGLEPLNIFDDNPRSSVVDIPNFYNYFIIRIDDGNEQLIDVFKPFLPDSNEYELHLLDFAYLKGDEIEASSSSIPRDTNQNYFDYMNIDVTHLIGSQIKISVVEINKWNLNHKELTHINPNLIFPKSSNPDEYLKSTSGSSHGNKMLGVLGANSTDGNNCKGITPQATFQLSSSTITDTNFSITKILAVENAIWAAIHNSSKGDVVLIEFENVEHFPIEFQPAVYQLFKYATQKGIIVIEPAGNEGSATVSLENRGWGNLKIINKMSGRIPVEVWTHNEELTNKLENDASVNAPKKQTYRDYLLNNKSGAILVGAAIQESGDNRKFTRISNWGKNICLYAQGAGITAPDTTGYSALGTGHTSAASAIIAGVIGLLQASVKGRGKYFNSSQIEELLYSTATIDVYNKTSTNEEHKVGKIPNYQKVFNQLGTIS